MKSTKMDKMVAEIFETYILSDTHKIFILTLLEAATRLEEK